MSFLSGTRSIKAVRSRRPDSTRALLDEARVVSRLQHPNIVTLFDALQDGVDNYLVFEFVAGTTLDCLIRGEGHIEKMRAATLAMQVLEGLAFAHGKDVVHRDIKPANIMVVQGTEVKVADFGAAFMRSATTTQIETIGSPAYMAPEQFQGKALFASDIYSLGATFFQMLTGQPPFVGATADDTLRLHAEAPVPNPATLNPKVPAGLQQIVARMLAKKPAARFQSCDWPGRHWAQPMPIVREVTRRRSTAGTVLLVT